MSLTKEQKKFLEEFLSTRPVTADPLGGKALKKVKELYEKFCKERQKLNILIKELSGLSGCEELGSSFGKSLNEIDKSVETAATTGDEKVFEPAHKDMESLRKECQKSIDQRKQEIKAVPKDVANFQKVFVKITNEKNTDKKTAGLKLLKEKMQLWMKNHHHGEDTKQAWPTLNDIVEQLGGPDASDLQMAVQELERQSQSLTKDIMYWDDSGLDWITINAGNEFHLKVYELQRQLAEYLEAAQKLGKNVAVKQLMRIIPWVDYLEAIVCPVDLLEEENEVEPEEEKKVEPQLTSAEQGKNKLMQSDGGIELLQKSYDRVRNNLETFNQQLIDLKKSTESAASLLASDFELLESAISTTEKSNANDNLQNAETELLLAKQKRQEMENAIEGDWKKPLEELVNAVETGLRYIDNCEKTTGQVEGGLLYIERSFETIQKITERVQRVDVELLEKLLDKVPLIKECDKSFAKDAELDLLKQLVFVSGLETDQIRSALGNASSRERLDQAIKQFIEGPKLSSLSATQLLSECHMICVDAARYFGTVHAYKESLKSEKDKKKFDKIKKAAAQDIAKFTVPCIPPPERRNPNSELVSVGVAVVGGGPIGLLAAVEARMAGASQVHVYEGRNDPYSRLNVLKIDSPQLQRFRTAGIFDAIFPKGVIGTGTASVKSIEMALEDRCNMLGIRLERGLFLVDVKRNEDGEVELLFQGEDKPKTCDVLIVATGASIASAQKHANNVVLSDNLGVPIQKSEVKDYAAVGVFSKNSTRGDGKNNDTTDGWAYDFETDEVKYIVTQLTEEEYKKFCDDPLALRNRIVEDAKNTKLIGQDEKTTEPRKTTASTDATIDKNGLEKEINDAWDRLLNELGGTNFLGSSTIDKDEEMIKKAKKRAKGSLETSIENNVKKLKGDKLSPADIEKVVLTFMNMELGVSRFPMEFQQAKKFATKDLTGVLVGDSAATPHPSTAKGLNTGVDEMGSVRDLVQDLQTGEGSEEERKKALQMYEFETKRRTDYMVNMALNALQTGARSRCTKIGAKIAQLLAPKGFDLKNPTTIYTKIVDFINPKLLCVQSKNEPKPSDFTEITKKDSDWKLREAAVKAVRDFETKLQKALSDIELLVETDSNNSATLEDLIKPFEKIVS